MNQPVFQNKYYNDQLEEYQKQLDSVQQQNSIPTYNSEDLRYHQNQNYNQNQYTNQNPNPNPNQYYETNPKEKGIALILWLFGGPFCLYNFYLGREIKGKKVLGFSLSCFVSFFLSFFFMGAGAAFDSISCVIVGGFLILVGFINLLVSYVYWLVDLFRIILGSIRDDHGRLCFSNTNRYKPRGF